MCRVLLIFLSSYFCIVRTESQCRIPFTNEMGNCVPLEECRHLKAITMRDFIFEPDRDQLIASICFHDHGYPPFVCCQNISIIPTIINNMDNLQQNTVSTQQTEIILLEYPKCGIQTFTDKIIGGTVAAIDEFPWTVILEYKRNDDSISAHCGGVLITEKYVLTAAHCAIGEVITKIGFLVSVVLGEFNTNTNPDCVQNDCADPIVRIGIEEVIAHEEFFWFTVHKYNDIAIIRLKETVVFSDFIKPICLPFTKDFTTSHTGLNLFTTGWGWTSNIVKMRSNIKVKLELPVFDHDECIEKYSILNVTIANSQICAGGKANEDTCKGDSGGPLMKLVGRSWYLEGIISFGIRCGTDGWPGIYTRVENYIDWIRSNMRP